MEYCNCEIKLLKLKASYNTLSPLPSGGVIVIARQSYLN